MTVLADRLQRNGWQPAHYALQSSKILNDVLLKGSNDRAHSFLYIITPLTHLFLRSKVSDDLCFVVVEDAVALPDCLHQCSGVLERKAFVA